MIRDPSSIGGHAKSATAGPPAGSTPARSAPAHSGLERIRAGAGSSPAARSFRKRDRDEPSDAGALRRPPSATVEPARGPSPDPSGGFVGRLTHFLETLPPETPAPGELALGERTLRLRGPARPPKGRGAPFSAPATPASAAAVPDPRVRRPRPLWATWLILPVAYACLKD